MNGSKRCDSRPLNSRSPLKCCSDVSPNVWGTFNMMKLRTHEIIEVDVPGVSSTSACRHLVEEIIKFVLECRRILPYPIAHLNTVINVSSESVNDQQNFDVVSEQLHIKKARGFNSKLLYIFQGLNYEFSKENWKNVRMIALLFGPTINCPKEVYLIRIPDVFCESDSKIDKNDTMRHVVLNNDMMNFLGRYVPRNNMFVLLLKPVGDNASWLCPLVNYKIFKKAPIALLKLAPSRNKRSKNTLLKRSKCREVDLIIDELCKRELYDKNCRRDGTVVLQAKYAESSDPGQPSSIAKRSRSSSRNTPIESLSSDAVEMGFSKRRRSSIETSNEKLMWYLCTEHLTSYKEPKKSAFRGKKQKII